MEPCTERCLVNLGRHVLPETRRFEAGSEGRENSSSRSRPRGGSKRDQGHCQDIPEKRAQQVIGCRASATLPHQFLEGWRRRSRGVRNWRWHYRRSGDTLECSIPSHSCYQRAPSGYERWSRSLQKPATAAGVSNTIRWGGLCRDPPNVEDHVAG